MVFYSEQFETDLEQIFRGLLTWKKHELEYEHVISYKNDLKNECISLEFKTYHFNSLFPNHKQFGKHVHRYQRNKNTTWYIVYNKDEYRNVYIERIFSSHTQVIEK